MSFRKARELEFVIGSGEESEWGFGEPSRALVLVCDAQSEYFQRKESDIAPGL